MNKWLEKKIVLIVTVFLLIQPLLDIITSISIRTFNFNLTLGIIIRTCFMIYALYNLWFVIKNKYTKIINIYSFLILLYMLLYSINIVLTKDFHVLVYEISGLIRTFYFPIILIFIFQMYNENKKINQKYLIYLFFIYAGLILIPNLLGLGYPTYSITKKGNIGLFNTANEVSGILSLLFPLVLAYILKNKWVLIIPFILICFYITFSIGNKVPLIAFTITILFYILYYLIKTSLKKKIIIISSILIISYISLSFIIPKTTFYKNIIIHLKFLKIDSVSELLHIENIDQFLFSRRITFMNDTKHAYDKANISSKLLGIGYIKNYSTDLVNTKTIEMDYYDIYYSHGIIGFILYFSFIIYLIISIVRQLFNNFNPNKYPCLISLIFILLLSLFSGHILTSPAVSIYCAIIIVILYNKKESYENSSSND